MTACAVALLAVVVGWLARPGARATRPSGSSRASSTERRRSARGRATRIRRSSSDDEVGEVERLRTVLGAGGSVLAAFAALASAGGPWAEGASGVVRRVRAGTATRAAIDRWGMQGGPSLVADALAIAGATGASQTAALDVAARTLRDRRSLEREIRALSSQAVASAVVVAAAPVGFALLVAAVDGRVRSFLLGTVVGPACVVAGLLLDAIGAWWMRSLVRRVR